MDCKWFVITFAMIFLHFQISWSHPSTGVNSDVFAVESVDLESAKSADPQADVDPPADSQADVDPPGEVNEISMEPFELEQDDNDINFMENPSEPQKSDLNDEMEGLKDSEDAGTQQMSSYTGWRAQINFKCRPGNALYYIYSYHSNSYEDRRWRFGCRKISSSALRNCRWRTRNAIDGMQIQECPVGYAVTRIYSPRYNSGAKDRQFNIKCCRASTVTSTCSYTSYLNAWDGALSFSASSSYIITGIFSHHDNRKEDRRFVVRYCRHNYKC